MHMFLKFTLLVFCIAIAYGVYHYYTMGLLNLSERFNDENMICNDVCKNKVNQLHAIMSYDSNKVTNKVLDDLMLIGPAIFGDMEIMTRLRDKVIQASHDVLMNQQEMIVFFDKPNFQGKMYFIPKRDMNHRILTMTTEQDLYDKRGVISNNNVHENKPYIDINTFIQHFAFFYGRVFSCIVPDGTTVTLHPMQNLTYPSQPLVIVSGASASVQYYKASLRAFNIMVGNSSSTL